MFKRIFIYLKEMFPLASFLGTMLTATSVILVYLRFYDVRPEFRPILLVPGLVLVCINLLIRVMDEFKDYEDDLRNFPSRPLPSGRVKKNDLSALGVVCILGVIFLSSMAKPLLIWGLLTLCFTGLMLKWFFIEKLMRKSLPLALITHHPIVIFNFVYLILFCIELDPKVGWDFWPMIFPICLIFTNWEFERKIRAPEQETAYTTYSKIWGPRKAIGLALILQFIFSFCVLAIMQKLESPIWLKSVFGILSLGLIFPAVRFLLTLRLKSALKPVAESQILLVILSLLVASLV